MLSSWGWLLLVHCALVADGAVDKVLEEPLQPCWLQPLQVEMSELVQWGRMHQAARRHCFADPRTFDPLRHSTQSYTVAQTRFGSLKIFGERLSFGLDVVASPQPGGPDAIFVAPAIDLPESWQEVISAATYPVLVIGGAALITSVVMHFVNR